MSRSNLASYRMCTCSNIVLVDVEIHVPPTPFAGRSIVSPRLSFGFCDVMVIVKQQAACRSEAEAATCIAGRHACHDGAASSRASPKRICHAFAGTKLTIKY